MTIPAHLAVALGLTSCEVSEEELEGRLLLAGLTHNSDSFNSPLLELVTNAPQVFVDIVLPALGSLELRMLAGVNTKMRDVVVTNSGEAATTKKEILRVATLVRSVSILAWARENGCPWDRWTCTPPLRVVTWKCCSGRARTAARGLRGRVGRRRRAGTSRYCSGRIRTAAHGTSGRARTRRMAGTSRCCCGRARANGCPWNEWTCTNAANGGHLEVLQWARANGCLWSEETCWEAASHGHLEVLQWAREHGCKWDAYTCVMAARGGHLEVLQWARANECPWDKYTCVYARKHGHHDLLKWAIANGCPYSV